MKRLTKYNSGKPVREKKERIANGRLVGKINWCLFRWMVRERAKSMCGYMGDSAVIPEREDGIR